MTDMNATVATISVIEDEGGFFYSLDHGASRVGPFETEGAATDAASDMLTEAFADMARQALFGETK